MIITALTLCRADNLASLSQILEIWLFSFVFGFINYVWIFGLILASFDMLVNFHSILFKVDYISNVICVQSLKFCRTITI